MAFDGLNDFISLLSDRGELDRIKILINPELEIAEITSRVVKNKGKALLFENTGTDFPLLINMYGSEDRMSLAIGRSDLEEAGKELEALFNKLGSTPGGFFTKLKILPGLFSLSARMPKKIRGRGRCQQVINRDPDLMKFPVLKCWPHDGGRFITLPVVHTSHPDTGVVNAGMYRMQIFDSRTTGMHWHRHKTGAIHYNAWKRKGKLMPVAVALGGDPVYAYSATAPLPEGIDEYILAGFLRKKRITMVRCITQDLFVPEDADIIIEGYIDTAEELAWEGPFGDHTGFYSLADWYPRFHVTCITNRKNAVYPATVVGVPPQEDTWIGLATEKLFLTPIRLTLQPEIIDIHMPHAGVAHNLVLVKIQKDYPGQGMKVINSLFGAGQMMFSKYIIVLDGEIDLRDYNAVIKRVLHNIDINNDLLVTGGPLDVLDHSSDNVSYGGKMGIDATHKIDGEPDITYLRKDISTLLAGDNKYPDGVSVVREDFAKKGLPLLIAGIDKMNFEIDRFKDFTGQSDGLIVFLLDESIDIDNNQVVAWQVLSNTDPKRDIHHFDKMIVVDSTAKITAKDTFPRDWPNVVISDEKTRKSVDDLWDQLQIGQYIKSPSLDLIPLVMKGKASVDKKS
jgi:4-hydroxy-3-polyprenylbenzoate decarboxylase